MVSSSLCKNQQVIHHGCISPSLTELFHAGGTFIINGTHVVSKKSSDMNVTSEF
jgi:hypothetical protein